MTGYAYTIGTGGTSVLALLRDHLLPVLTGQDACNVEPLWRLAGGHRQEVPVAFA